MKRVGIAVLLALLSAVTLDLWRGRYATLEWDYDYAKDPPCNAEVMRGKLPDKTCILGFNAFLGGVTKREEQQSIPNSFKANGTIVDKAIQAKLRVRHLGNVEFCVASLARDSNGMVVESDALCKKHLVLPWGLSK